MAAILHNEQKIDLVAEPVQLGEGKLDATYALAHLTGTAANKLTDKAKDELKQYVEGGGTLLVDACGGSGAFATDFETQLVSIFGGKGALPVLPLTHKILPRNIRESRRSRKWIIDLTLASCSEREPRFRSCAAWK